MANLTIRDIARMAGVSTTAVSFVLNGRNGVSDATREKVQEIIHRTGFIPNVHTRRLNLGRSFTIHLVLRQYQYNLYNQFAMETLFGMFTASKALGYSLIFTFVDEKMDCEQLLESVRSKDCDGVVLDQVSDPRLLSQLQQEQVPFLCVDSHVKHDGAVPLVEVDYYHAAYAATHCLIENGHRDIGYLGPEEPYEFYLSTFSGYTDAMRDAGLSCNPAWMPKIAFSEQSARGAATQLLKLPKLPSAIFCAGDPFAIDMLSCAKEHGLRVPEQLSLISLDDLVVSRYLDPPLSSMTFDKEKLGELAMQVLVRIINGEPYDKVTLIPTQLVQRGSVRDLNLVRPQNA